jgi:hypothetical protein
MPFGERWVLTHCFSHPAAVSQQVADLLNNWTYDLAPRKQGINIPRSPSCRNRRPEPRALAALLDLSTSNPAAAIVEFQ